MRILWRLILVLYGLAIAFLSLIIIATVLVFNNETILSEIFSDQIRTLMEYQWSSATIICVFVLLFLISLNLVFGHNKKDNSRMPITMIKEGGQLEISLETFENIAVSTLKKTPEAKDYSAKAKRVNNDISITIKMSVLPEVNIPSLVEQIQTKVVEAVESTTGVKVVNVLVRIEDLANGFKGRVE